MMRANKPVHWVSDKEAKACHACLDEFTVRKRKHHCRHCGQIFCADCTTRRYMIPRLGLKTPSRVCEGCYNKLTADDDDKSHIEETLDAKDMMLASLKGALHQKVLLLDKVKSILTEIVLECHDPSVNDGTPTKEKQKSSPGEDDPSGSDQEEEDESVETHLDHVKQAFSKLHKRLQESGLKADALQATKQHLEEELSMRVAYALQTERNYQLQVVELRNENEKMKELLNQDDHSSSASPSTEHHQHSVSHAPFDSSRSVCSMLREMFCWPLHAMFRVLHPTEDQHDVRGVPYATKRRDLLHNDHNGLICCRRRPRVENGTSLLEETIL